MAGYTGEEGKVAMNFLHAHKDPNKCCISCGHLVLIEKEGQGRQQCELSGITRRAMSDAEKCQEEGKWILTEKDFPFKGQHNGREPN